MERRDKGIKVSREAEERLVKSVKRYFREQTGEEIGDLKAGLFLDFCLREVGPCVYNQAVADVQGLLAGRIADLEGECHEPEFGYWKKDKGG
jgi:uncharacterized protein (DUF2164 family)